LGTRLKSAVSIKGMFDQMQVAEKHTSPWAVMLSVTTQTAIVGSVLLISILKIQTLDLRALVQTPPLIAPPIPRFVRVVSIERAGSGPVRVTLAPPRVFTAPRTIPQSVAMINDIGTAVHEISSFDVVGPSAPAVIHTEIRATPPALRPQPAGTQAADIPSAPIRIGGNVLAAMRISEVLPVYPPLAKAARISGTVKLIGIIGRDGTVQDLHVVEGHPLLVKAALDAVRQWRYRPTLLNGEPVEVTAPIDVRFVLN
jgi:periplasmic protein TonB